MSCQFYYITSGRFVQNDVAGRRAFRRRERRRALPVLLRHTRHAVCGPARGAVYPQRAAAGEKQTFTCAPNCLPPSLARPLGWLHRAHVRRDDRGRHGRRQRARPERRRADRRSRRAAACEVGRRDDGRVPHQDGGSFESPRRCHRHVPLLASADVAGMLYYSWGEVMQSCTFECLDPRVWALAPFVTHPRRGVVRTVGRSVQTCRRAVRWAARDSTVPYAGSSSKDGLDRLRVACHICVCVCVCMRISIQQIYEYINICVCEGYSGFGGELWWATVGDGDDAVRKPVVSGRWSLWDNATTGATEPRAASDVAHGGGYAPPPPAPAPLPPPPASPPSPPSRIRWRTGDTAARSSWVGDYSQSCRAGRHATSRGDVRRRRGARPRSLRSERRRRRPQYHSSQSS